MRWHIQTCSCSIVCNSKTLETTQLAIIIRMNNSWYIHTMMWLKAMKVHKTAYTIGKVNLRYCWVKKVTENYHFYDADTIYIKLIKTHARYCLDPFAYVAKEREKISTKFKILAKVKVQIRKWYTGPLNTQEDPVR